jgi:hypothetical protein
MHGVVLTPTFQRQADRLRLSEEEVMAIVTEIATDPLAGDLIVGSGGARKLRHRRSGGGTSGGYRTIHYFGGDDSPSSFFLLSIFGKGAKSDLTARERNDLAAILPKLAQAYRHR